MRTKIVKQDQTVLDSMIESCTYTAQVNTAVNIEPGACVCGMIEVTARGTIAVEYGERITYIQVDGKNEDVVGVFWVEKPVQVTQTLWKFTAYDSIIKLETDVSGWLNDLNTQSPTPWPMTCSELISALATEIGVTIDTTGLSAISVNAFYKEGVTARQIFMWTAQVSGKFVVTDYQGRILFRWYRWTGKVIGFEDSYNASMAGDALPTFDGDADPENDTYDYGLNSDKFYPYYMGGLNMETITSLQPEYVSVVNPVTAEIATTSAMSGGNGTLKIYDNPLLSDADLTELQTVADFLKYSIMFDPYRPCNVRIPITRQIRPGHLLLLCPSIPQYAEDEDVPIPDYYLIRVTKTVMDESGTYVYVNGSTSYDSASNTSSYSSDIQKKEETAAKSVWYGVCNSSSNTANKIVDCVGFSNANLQLGTILYVRFLYYPGYMDGTDRTMKVGDSDYIPLYSSYLENITAREWENNETVCFVFDKRGWVIVDGNHATTNTYGYTCLSSSLTSSYEDRAATPYAVKQLNDIKLGIFNNPGFHNSIFRGASLGSYITNNQNRAIQDRSYSGMFIGDYWTINGRVWRIAAIDYYYRVGNTSYSRGNIIVVPDVPLYKSKMNETNVTTGGYPASYMFKSTTGGLTEARSIASTDFGSHLANNSIMDTTGAWRTSDGVELMSEVQAYGSKAFGTGSMGSLKMQFPLFAVSPEYLNIRYDYWLQDVASSTNFSLVNSRGHAATVVANYEVNVRPAVTLTYTT